MIISIIAAVDLNGGIGKSNQLPWRLKDDLIRFKRLTMGHFLIMGRKTYDSIGKALSGRKFIIVTRNQKFRAKDSLIAYSIDEALNIAIEHQEVEVFITGGGEIYSQTLDLADRLYLTTVQAVTESDVYFPAVDRRNWVKKWSVYQPADTSNQFPFIFEFLERHGNVI